MRITAQTTDEQLLAPVVSAREALAKKATEETVSEALLGYLHNLAEAEGQAEVRYTLRDALAHGATEEQIERSLTRHLLRGADDTWSGRKNDLKRVKHDAVREEIRTLTDFGVLKRIVAGSAAESRDRAGL